MDSDSSASFGMCACLTLVDLPMIGPFMLHFLRRAVVAHFAESNFVRNYLFWN